MKHPLQFVSGQFVDGDGRTIPVEDIIARMHVFDDLARAASLLQFYAPARSIPPLAAQDAAQTLDVVKRLKPI